MRASASPDVAVEVLVVDEPAIEARVAPAPERVRNEAAGRVAGAAEHLRKRREASIEIRTALLARAMLVHPAPRHQRRVRRQRPRRRRIRIEKHPSLARKPIESRCRRPRVAVRGNVIGAQRVGDEHENIGPSLCRGQPGARGALERVRRHRLDDRDHDDQAGERHQRAAHERQRVRAAADEHPCQLRADTQCKQQARPRREELTLQPRAEIAAADQRDEYEHARPIPAANPPRNRVEEEREHGCRDRVDDRRDPEHARRVAAAPGERARVEAEQAGFDRLGETVGEPDPEPGEQKLTEAAVAGRRTVGRARQGERPAHAAPSATRAAIGRTVASRRQFGIEARDRVSASGQPLAAIREDSLPDDRREVRLARPAVAHAAPHELRAARPRTSSATPSRTKPRAPSYSESCTSRRCAASRRA